MVSPRSSASIKHERHDPHEGVVANQLVAPPMGETQKAPKVGSRAQREGPLILAQEGPKLSFDQVWLWHPSLHRVPCHYECDSTGRPRCTFS